MRSSALSCKLLPGVAPSDGACRDSQLLAYIQIQVMQIDPHSKSYTCGLCTYLRRQWNPKQLRGDKATAWAKQCCPDSELQEAEGECLNGDAEPVPSGARFLVSIARNLLSGCCCGM
jgi:hypothetical protein